jgi:5-(carboxyamino)imidazole ribonucleotide synthase
VTRKLPTVGILGGGQLARMLSLAAAPLGIRTLVVDGSADACAGQVTDLVVADWFDDAAIDDFASRVDVVTFDFENVPAAVAERLAAKVAVFPNPRALAVAQDRLSEKTLFRESGLDTPDFEPVDTREDLVRAVERIGAPAVLKTRRLGYDGKGQFRLKTAGDIDAAWDALGEAAGKVGLILEAFVPFEREVSVVAVRGRDGAFRSWPLTRNWHVDGVLSLSLAPSPGCTDELERAANAHARKVAETLDYVGVFALELFVCNGRLLGNEMAPRVHNSGHWTIEGAHTSQFENHVRAVLGLPLGDTGVRGPSAMLNWIGEMPDPSPVLNVADGHWHDYGKEARPGRKVGHATVCAPDAGSLREKLAAVGKGLGREDQVAPAIEALK